MKLSFIWQMFKFSHPHSPLTCTQFHLCRVLVFGRGIVAVFLYCPSAHPLLQFLCPSNLKSMFLWFLDLYIYFFQFFQTLFIFSDSSGLIYPGKGRSCIWFAFQLAVAKIHQYYLLHHRPTLKLLLSGDSLVSA